MKLLSLLVRMFARICEWCPVCRRARARQNGLAFGFVRTVEGKLCPFCKAYEKIHSCKAHEPVPQPTDPSLNVR